MALTKCAVCGGEISAEAQACLQCSKGSATGIKLVNTDFQNTDFQPASSSVPSLPKATLEKPQRIRPWRIWLAAMLKGRRRIYVIGVAVVVLFLGIWLIRSALQPRHQGKTVAQWARILKTSPEKSERQQAAAALAKFEPPPEPAMQALVATLGDEDSDVRESVVAALAAIGSETVPHLTKALKHEDSLVRTSAALALGRIGSEAKEAVIRLGRLVRKDDTPEVRESAATALGNIGADAKAAVPALTAALKHDTNVSIRVSVAKALGQIGPGAKTAVPALVLALEEQSQSLRFESADALGKIGPDAKAAIPHLVAYLKKDNVPGSLHHGALALIKIGRPAIPSLIEAMKSKDDNTRNNASEALAKIGGDAVLAILPIFDSYSSQESEKRQRAAASLALSKMDASAVPAMSKGLRSHPSARGAIFAAFSHLGPKAKAAVPTLVDMLKRSRSQEGDVLEVLAKIGPEAKAAVPVLGERLEKKSYVSDTLFETLRAIGPDAVPAVLRGMGHPYYSRRNGPKNILMQIGPKCVPFLIKALKQKNPTIRSRAAIALGWFEEKATTAIPPLIQALRDNNREVRYNAIHTLRRFGPHAKAAVPRLIEFVENKKSGHQEDAVQALGEIGSEAKAALPHLRKLLGDRNFRSELLQVAFGKIGVSGIPILVKALKDKNERVRCNAAYGLGRIGPAAKAAIPALRALNNDPDRNVRYAASFAIGQIQR